MTVLPLEIRNRVLQASDVVIVEDNARRPKFSHTESVDPVQLVHFGSSWMKFTSCPSKEKKRMQLQNVGASRSNSRWGGPMQKAHSSSNLIDTRNSSAPYATTGAQGNEGSMALRRITSESSVFSNASPPAPARAVSPRMPQRRSSVQDSESSNATWNNPPRPPQAGSPLMGRLGVPGPPANGSPMMIGSPPMAASPQMRHTASETSLNQKHAAPRLPSRRGYDNNRVEQQGLRMSASTSGLRMPQRRGSDSIGNAAWDAGSSSSSGNPSVSAQLPSSKKNTSPGTLMRRFHPAMAPGGVKRRSPQRTPATFAKHKDSFLLNAVAPLCAEDDEQNGLKIPQRRSSGMENATWGNPTPTPSSDAGRALMNKLSASRTMQRGSHHGMPCGNGDGKPSRRLSSGLSNAAMLNGSGHMTSAGMNQGFPTDNSTTLLPPVGGMPMPMMRKGATANPLLQRAAMTGNPLLRRAAGEMPKLPSKPQPLSNHGIQRSTSDAGPSAPRRAAILPTAVRRSSVGPSASPGGLRIPQRRASIETNPEDMAAKPQTGSSSMRANSYLCALSIIAEKSKSHSVRQLNASSSTIDSFTTSNQTSTSQHDASTSSMDASSTAEVVSNYDTDSSIGEDSTIDGSTSTFEGSVVEEASSKNRHPMDELSFRPELQGCGDRRLLIKKSLSSRTMRKPERRLSNDGGTVMRERPKLDRGLSEPVLFVHRKPRSMELDSPSKAPSLEQLSSSFAPVPEKCLSSLDLVAPELVSEPSRSTDEEGVSSSVEKKVSLGDLPSLELLEAEPPLVSSLKLSTKGPVEEKKEQSDDEQVSLAVSCESTASLHTPLAVTELARKKIMPPKSRVRQRKERPLEELFPPVTTTSEGGSVRSNSPAKQEGKTESKSGRRRMSRKSSLNSLASVIGLRPGILRTRSVETLSTGTSNSTEGSIEPTEEQVRKKRPNRVRRMASSLGIGRFRRGFSSLSSKRTSENKSSKSPDTPVSTPPESPKKITKTPTYLEPPELCVAIPPRNAAKNVALPSTPIRTRKVLSQPGFPRRHSIDTVSGSNHFGVPQAASKRRNSMDYNTKRRESMNMIDMVDEAELLRRQRSIRFLSKTVKRRTVEDRPEFLNRIDGHVIKKKLFRRRNTLSTMPSASVDKSTTRRRNSLNGMLMESHRQELERSHFLPSRPSPRSALEFSDQDDEAASVSLAEMKVSL